MTCDEAGCHRCWDNPEEYVSYGYHDPEGAEGALPMQRKYQNLQQLEVLGYHRLVDKLLKQAHEET
jgi:hypothetical protein